MIMAGFEFMGKEPFKDVYIHGTVRDIEGKKMSKSLGNVIDPLEIINEYGCDALRFSLISITTQGQDVFLSKERFEQGRNFANKVWNASRFIIMNLDQTKVNIDLCVFFKKEELSHVNRWILSRFYSVLKDVEANLKAYKFNEAANLIYAFFWHEFCDWYLEIINPQILHQHNQVVMYKVLEKSLRLMHPFMPFLSEEIWQMLRGSHEAIGESIMDQPWPHLQKEMIDEAAEESLNGVFEIINAVRNMRSELDIALNEDIEVKLSVADRSRSELFEDSRAMIANLCRMKKFTLNERYLKVPGEFVLVFKDMHIAIPLCGVVDIEKYKLHLAERLEKAKQEIEAKRVILSNENFLKKAPAEIVGKEKEKLEELNSTLKKMEAIRDGFR
jgi:valyl-tRNA synthetase